MRLMHVLLAATLAVAACNAGAQAPAAPPPAVHARGAFVALDVPDLEASARWYRDVLGLRETFRIVPAGEPGTGVVVLEGGGLAVELVQHAASTPRPPEPARNHGPFKAGVVVADLDAVVATLRARGADIAYGPFAANAQQRANVIVRDNAGNLLQFFGDRGDADARAAVAAASLAFSDAVVRNDMDALAALYTEDGVLLPPNKVVRGRAAIAEHFRWREGFRQVAHSMVADELVVHDDVVIDSGTWTSTSQRGDAAPTTTSGRYLVVWERGSDGAWRMRYDAWHRPPTP